MEQIGTLYDAGDLIDHTLVAKIDLPVYSSYPTNGYPATKIGTVKAGDIAGKVYSFISPDVADGRPQLWWMFYPGSMSGGYYYIPHGTGYFDINSLVEQGIESELQKNQEPQTWYEKIISQVLPVIAITVIGAAAIRGYFSSKK